MSMDSIVPSQLAVGLISEYSFYSLEILFYFRTPAYQDPDIQSDVTVQFQLFRPSNQSTSEAKSFTYTPRERVGMTAISYFLL